MYFIIKKMFVITKAELVEEIILYYDFINLFIINYFRNKIQIQHICIFFHIL